MNGRNCLLYLAYLADSIVFNKVHLQFSQTALVVVIGDAENCLPDMVTMVWIRMVAVNGLTVMVDSAAK